MSVILILLLMAAPADNTLSPVEQKEGWQLLFNGTDLTGWMWSRDPAPPSPSWAAEAGTLRTTPGKGAEVYLLTRDSFTDFEFRFEWKAEPKANSGVKYRFQGFGDSSRRLEPMGLEYQITDDEANPDALSTPKHAAGALYEYVAPTKTTPALPGVWHRSRIVARGLHIEHWLDDLKILDLDLDSPQAEAAFAASTRRSATRLRKQEQRESQIALQIHDGNVWFRNLKIRRF